MNTALVDPEGFPRSDIDVAGVRTARSQIIRLRNDLKGIIEEMGRLLERGLPRGDAGDIEMTSGGGVVLEEVREAWAKVDSVARGSPAEVAVRSLDPSSARGES